MSRIVCAFPESLPEGKFYITDVPYDSRIIPGKLDAFFDSAHPAEGTLAEILLQNEATAIYHLNPQNLGRLRGKNFVKPLLLGANYHNGHSEGDHKIIVQDVVSRRGPWVLFKPPGSEEKTFYLQHMVFPSSNEPRFEEEVANPLKIKRRFLHHGNPDAIFNAFRELGFDFVDKAMTKSYMEEVGY